MVHYSHYLLLLSYLPLLEPHQNKILTIIIIDGFDWIRLSQRAHTSSDALRQINPRYIFCSLIITKIEP